MTVVCGLDAYERFYGFQVARTGLVPLPDASRETRVGPILPSALKGL
jgi:hypothetical protein